MFARAFIISALALVAVATDCPNCPSTDLVGNFLVAMSGGTLGTPRFCGYSPDKTGASGPSVECFYNDSTGTGTGPGASCPATAPIANVC
ncbi:hypothetical protein C8R44DRAFT_672660 [Mycena epipterygia]|nr:hypothetical protein C8R44DRAFT_672660 [Mycena epipterygia]